MLSVYLESSVISYLAAQPSRKEIVVAHQLVTHRWWNDKRHGYDLFVSEKVITEISGGNPEKAAKRLEWIAGIPVLKSSPETRELVRRLLQPGILPIKAAADAVHMAIAVVNGVDFLATWNCRHLANAVIRRKIENACESMGFKPSLICTPDMLLGEEDGSV